MNECKVCGNECTGKTCSGSCRAKLSRAHAHGLTEEAHGQAHALDMSQLVEDWAGPDCQCGHCCNARRHEHKRRLNHGAWLTAEQLEVSDYDGNRVSIPGDVDYVGTCKG